jgi:N-acetylglucosamine-6-phosphate deacetylase
MLLRGRHFSNKNLLDLHLQNGLIRGASPATSTPPDLQADWLAPAICDIQVNGGLGVSFTADTLDASDLRRVMQACRPHGIGCFLPTVVTAARQTLVHAFTALRTALERDAELAAAVPGFHLEGPFIAAADGPRGAHPAQHTRPPDLREFLHLQECAGGRIRLVTLAPELPGAVDFIRAVTAQGVVVALGHSAAGPDDIRAAVAAGARLSTHLGNGAPRLLPRHANLLWEQLANDSLWASIITDGHHLPEAVLRCIIRCKAAGRLILTCDVSPWGGMPPGRYGQWDQQVDVRPEGKIMLAGQELLAGSWNFTDHCVTVLSRLRELPADQVLALATTQPRALLGLPALTLAPGEPAHVTAWDEDPEGGLRLKAVVWNGQFLVPGSD